MWVTLLLAAGTLTANSMAPTHVHRRHMQEYIKRHMYLCRTTYNTVMHKGQSQCDHTGTLYIGEHNAGIWKNRDLINAWTLSCCKAEQIKQCTCYVSHGMWVNATAGAHNEVQNLTAEQRSCICRLWKPQQRTVYGPTFHLSGPVHCIPAAGVGVPSSWPVTVCPHPQVAQVLRRRNDNMKENEHERDNSPDCVDCKTQLLL